MSVQNWEVGTVTQLALGSGCQSVAAPAATTEEEVGARSESDSDRGPSRRHSNPTQTNSRHNIV